MESRSWPLEQLRDLQEQHLRRLLTHAVRASPWYREKLRDVPDPARFRLDELRYLPILEKSELQEHLDEIAGSARAAPDVRENYSSGSTGMPVRVYQSQEYRDWYAAELDRSYLGCRPFRLGMPRAFFWGTDIDSRAHRGAVGTVRDSLVNILWFDAFALRRDGLGTAARRLRAFRPAMVIGYVSTLTEIARALDRPLDGLVAVVTAAETLTLAERTVIAESFGAPVFDRYATREVGTIAHECEAHDGLHLVMENNIVEIVGPDGQPRTQADEEGEILITSLRNLATPLVRYRLSDVARLGGGGCPCGRQSVRLDSVLGRTSDLIVSPRGILLHALFFMRLFDKTPVQRFRVDQETPSRLRIRVVPAAQYSDDVRLRITSGILTHGDPAFEVAWEVVTEIPATSSGKFRFTVSHLGKVEPSRLER
jgi:phenylacetate-CoA ligase